MHKLNEKRVKYIHIIINIREHSKTKNTVRPTEPLESPPW